jgi:uncharacterized membrane protein YbhN (UPF0104 family)
MNRHYVGKLLPLLISLGLLIGFTVFLKRNAVEFRSLLDVSAPRIFLLITLILATHIGNGAMNQALYRALGAPIGLRESIGLSVVNNLANFLPFAGGMMAKGVYLKRRYGLSYSNFISATLALFAIMVAASGLMGLLTLLVMELSEDNAPWILVAGFAAMTVVMLAFFVPHTIGVLPSGVKEKIAQLLSGWRVIGSEPLLLMVLLLYQFLALLLTAGRYWAAFRLMSQPVSVFDCILFAAASTLTQLVTITPDGLGIREAIVGGVASLLGFDIGVSIVAVTIDRLVSTALTLAIGSAASYHLSRRLGDGAMPAKVDSPLS